MATNPTIAAIRSALPKPYYSTGLGSTYLGDSRKLMARLPNECIDLIVTSPPYALQSKKPYGNESPERWVDWFMPFVHEMRRILKPQGSLVLNIGGSWKKGSPVKNIYLYELLVDLCSDRNRDPLFHLAQEIWWYNPAKLPSPAQWVTVNRLRHKDAVEPIWWLSKLTEPQTFMERVKWPYSEAMEKLIKRGTYNAGDRPSGWNISGNFARDNGGAIPPNILPISNTESNSSYSVQAKSAGFKLHPARFPVALPAYFIELLTSEGDIVLDPFAGSVTTGEASESRDRQWLAFEAEKYYLRASRYRFPTVRKPKPEAPKAQ